MPDRRGGFGADVLEDLIAAEPPQAVLASDLNAAPDTASLRFWTGRQSLGGLSVCNPDAWEAVHPGKPEDTGHTFTRRNPLVARGEMPLEPGRRIDYILLRCSDHGPTLEVCSCERVFDQPEQVDQTKNQVWASDHFGILAELGTP